MKIRFWGVKGSLPSTLTSAEIEHKLTSALLGARGIDLSNKLQVQEYIGGLPPLIKGTVGNNTPCVSIEIGEELIILDAGSGLRTLGVELMKGTFGRGQGIAHILISHTHWDHIQGIPYFGPAYVQGNRIIFYSPFANLEERIRGQQNPEYFPKTLDEINADFSFVQLQEGIAVSVAGAQVNNILQVHPGRSYSYRLEGDDAVIVYATDAEYKDLGEAHTKRYVEFMTGADLLIFDAQFTLSDSFKLIDWGHSSSVIGVDMAKRAHVKRIALFHFQHTYTDMQIQEILETTQKYISSDPVGPKCEVYLATEGLEFDLGIGRIIRLKHHRVGDSIVLSISGRLDARASEQVDKQLTGLISDEPKAGLIIDLSQLTHLSVAGLKTLLNAQKMGQGVHIVLAAAPESIREVLARVGFGEAFTLYESVQKALAALEARQYLKLEGQVLHGRYRIESSLDMGHVAAVFKAFDTWFERPVTVKVLSKSLGDKAVNRLLHEARAVAHLNHPNIAAVYDCIEHRNQLYLIREYVDGLTLAHWLSKSDSDRPFSPVRSLGIVKDILKGLAYAHQRHVMHRTLSPINVILAEQGTKIINFGLIPQRDWSLVELKHISLEQISGEEPTAQSDLYSVGVILYRLITGQLPYDADTAEELIQIRMQLDPIAPRQLNPQIPLPLERITLNLLSRHPSDRYPSATMTLDALDGIEFWE
ncbi:MAG: protein kinase [Anaerolineae bacterium]|nr:protein kinase [Anaerolineae bacterium]